MPNFAKLLGLFSSVAESNDNDTLREVLTDASGITKTAESLIKEWKASNKQVWKLRETDKGTVESGLRTLLTRGLIDAARFAKVIGTGDAVGIAKEGIRVFQTLANSRRPGRVQSDGIFGQVTAKALREFNGCNPRVGRGPELEEDSEAALLHSINDEISLLICHIDPAVAQHFDPVLGDGKTVAAIANAWDVWIEHINVAGITQGVTRENANVVIEVGKVDGENGVKLADADVAGPNFLKQQLCTLTIDEEEQFNEEKFLWMMTHELGHIMGMGHYTQTDSMMQEFIDLSVKKLSQSDIDHIQRIWA